MERELASKFGGNWVVFRVNNGIAEPVESWVNKENAEKAAEVLSKWDAKFGYRYAVEKVSNKDLGLIKIGKY